MTRFWPLVVGLALTAPLGAAEAVAPQGLSASAAALSPSATALAPAPGPKAEGFTYDIGLSALSVFNGSPLSYTPFELGWRFENGLRVRGGIDLFYYEGLDTDEKKPEAGTQLYSYDMMDLRLSLLYAVPLPSRVRPIAGLTLEAIRGTRKLSGGVLNPPTLEAWGFLSGGATLGGEWRISDNLALELLARYTPSFGNSGALTGVGLDTAFLF